MTPTGLNFVYASPASRVLLGPGRVGEIGAELDRLGVRRALFVCTPSGASRYEGIAGSLQLRCAAVFARAEAHCPQPVAENALRSFDDCKADGVLAVGGGSTIGLGKFIAANRKIPFVAVPTTLSGSEMTALYGVKVGTEKRTANDPAAKPRTVIYDPALTATLPKHETATTGMNCLAHCVEALYPAQPNPIARLLALEGIRSLSVALPGVIERNDLRSRSLALYAGCLGGLLVSMVGIGLHHKICHVLGGHFDIAHGDSNSVILPHVVAFNAPVMPGVAEDIAGALTSNDPARGIFDLAVRIGAPTSLRALGVPQLGLRAVAEEVGASRMHNPRPVAVEQVIELLDAAWRGQEPRLGRL